MTEFSIKDMPKTNDLTSAFLAGNSPVVDVGSLTPMINSPPFMYMDLSGVLHATAIAMT